MMSQEVYRLRQPGIRRSKGQAAETNTVLVIVVLLIFFSIYIYMANSQTQSNIRLNLESLEIIKLKATFELFNQSLGATWFISMVQSVFGAADESIGCGYDNSFIDNGFWYQGRGDRARDFSYNNFTEFKQTADKYNKFGSNPQICYPRDGDIEAYINLKMQDYADLNKTLNAGGVEIKRGDPTSVMGVDEKSVYATFSQNVDAEYGRGTIKAKTENTAVMYTALKNMTESGRSAVEGMIALGDMFYSSDNTGLFYSPAPITPGANQYKNIITSLVASQMIVSNPHPEIKADVTVDGVKLSAIGLGRLEGTGLMVDYKATVRYSESAAAGIDAKFDWPTENRDITSCYGYRNDPIDDAGRAHNGIDIGGQLGAEIKTIAPGRVTDLKNNCTSTSGAECGSGYGNYVLIQNDGFRTFYAHLASVSVQAGQDVAAGETIGTMGSTGRSTGYHLHFEVRKERKIDPCGYIDCSLSTGKRCAVLGVSEFDYYYHDTDTNTFEKRPVTLEMYAEDHLPALDCLYWNKFYIDTYGRASPIMFNYEGANDLVCCNGYLFSCNLEIEGMTADQQLITGETTSDDEDPTSHRVCNAILGSRRLACGANGFGIE